MINRKKLMFGVGVGAAVLSMSSAAFACTIFRGTMTVSGNGTTSRSPSGTSPSTAIGNNTGMGYCSLTPGATAKATGGTVTVQVLASSAPCAVSTLTPNTAYDVNYVNGRAFYDPPGPARVYGWQIDCMSPISAGQVNLGSQTTDSLGNLASQTWNLPNGAVNASGEDSAVCVSTPNGGNGNQAPVQIVSV